MDESDVVKNECSKKDGVMQLKELKEAASILKLSDSINKVFGKCSGSGNGSPNTSRVKEVARKAKLLPTKRTKKIVVSDLEESTPPSNKSKIHDSVIVVEVVCMPSDSVVVPRGQYKMKLENADYVNYMKYKRSDSYSDIQGKIVSLFPKIVSSSSTFLFLDARTKHLEKMSHPPNGHCECEWDGNAIVTLTGQGRLYILPKESEKAGTSISGTVSTSSSSGLTMNLIDCSYNSISAATSDQHSPTVDESPDDSCLVDDSYDLPPAMLSSLLKDKLVGGAILEYADMQQCFYPSFEVRITVILIL